MKERRTMGEREREKDTVTGRERDKVIDIKGET